MFDFFIHPRPAACPRGLLFEAKKSRTSRELYKIARSPDMNLRQFFTTQTWWGKLLGAFLGYLIAGSAGALFGILIGNFFDRGLAEHFSQPYWQFYTESRKHVQQVFFHATFSIMGHLAKADGRVSEAEIKMASALMQKMRLNKAQIKTAQAFFNEGKKSTFSLSDTLLSLRDACHDNPELLKLFIDIQYQGIQTDGLSSNKVRIMNLILKHLGFAPLHNQYHFYEDFSYRRAGPRQQSYRGSSYQNTTTAPKSTLEHAYAILAVSKSANRQEVKQAYRRLISRNHPDKLIAQGLPEAMIKIANEKTQQIRKAYEQICASKGWAC